MTGRKQGRPVTTATFERVAIRVPLKLASLIRAESEKDFTSMNSIIMRRLMESYAKEMSDDQ